MARLFAKLIFVHILLAGIPARAGSSTTTETVAATVTNNCTIGAATLDFGVYDPVVVNHSVDKTSSASLSVTCTNGASTTIDLDQGVNPGTGSTGAVPLRQLASGANRLRYDLYQNVGLTTVWGTGGASFSYTGIGTTDTVTIYGKIAAGQNLSAGSYSDMVTETINF